MNSLSISKKHPVCEKQKKKKKKYNELDDEISLYLV